MHMPMTYMRVHLLLCVPLLYSELELDMPATAEPHASSGGLFIETCAESAEVFTSLRGKFTYMIHSIVPTAKSASNHLT